MSNRDDREIAVKKVAPLNERLDRQFGITIDFTSDKDHLRQVLAHYVAKRELMLEKHGDADAMREPDYTKAVLISEAVRLFLREIAPKRLRKKNPK